VLDYERDDFVKIELFGSTTGVEQWVWLVIDHCDHQNELVFGRVDNEPLHDHGGRLKVGSQVSVSYSQIREHRKAWEFKPN